MSYRLTILNSMAIMLLSWETYMVLVLPHSLHLPHSTLLGLHINQLSVVFLEHLPNIPILGVHIHNTCHQKKCISSFKTPCVLRQSKHKYLARRIALRSFFAVSAIRGTIRETLQLRRICEKLHVRKLTKGSTMVQYKKAEISQFLHSCPKIQQSQAQL